MKGLNEQLTESEKPKDKCLYHVRNLGEPLRAFHARTHHSREGLPSSFFLISLCRSAATVRRLFWHRFVERANYASAMVVPAGIEPALPT